MTETTELDGLVESISATVREYLLRLSSDTITRNISRPIIRLEAFLQDSPTLTETEPASRHLGSTIFDFSQVQDTLKTPPAGPERRRSIPETLTTVNGVVGQQDATEISEQASRTASTAGVDQSRTLHHARSESNLGENEDEGSRKRKATGGLRLAPSIRAPLQNGSGNESTRQLEIDSHTFPKRRKTRPEGHVMQPSSLDKLITGIWEQLYGSISLDPQAILDSYRLSIDPPQAGYIYDRRNDNNEDQIDHIDHTFSQMSVFCRKVTQASRACRSVELIVQARWIEHFDARVESLTSTRPDISFTKHRRAVLMEACRDFNWTEKELRNKMAVWRGYQEVKDAGGWVSLVFSGMGLYRFCKYRVDFDREAMQRLRMFRHRFEVSADTMHPHWRQLLSIIGESTRRLYDGHPHDWVISNDGDAPIPLRQTYLQWDPQFSFEHLDESIIDVNAWGCDDPRWFAPDPAAPERHVCRACGEHQSEDPKDNNCLCFPKLFGSSKRSSIPVQVMRIGGKNNGLIALIPFERGASIGEFTGLLTHSLANTDVMTAASPTTNRIFQIYQKRYGNHTRFVNHSCNPNAQFQQFAWLDTIRVVLVSKGINAEEEITVDYSDRYWGGLKKICLCGEPCCRYKNPNRVNAVVEEGEPHTDVPD